MFCFVVVLYFFNSWRIDMWSISHILRGCFTDTGAKIIHKRSRCIMMTSWHGNAFRFSGALWGECTGIFPPLSSTNVELWCSFSYRPGKAARMTSNILMCNLCYIMFNIYITYNVWPFFRQCCHKICCLASFILKFSFMYTYNYIRRKEYIYIYIHI